MDCGARVVVVLAVAVRQVAWLMESLTLPPPQPSPAADAGASCEGGGCSAVLVKGSARVQLGFWDGGASPTLRSSSSRCCTAFCFSD